MESNKLLGKEHDVILYPLISEKSMSGIPNLKYTFKVRKDSSKVDIRNAVEKIFNVKVSKVNTLMVRGRKRRRGRIIGFTPSWKKAVVSLASGQKAIEFFNQIA